MDEAHLLATVRYVERNPVAANLCARPEDWPWSSAAAHIKGEDDRLVQVKPMLERGQDWSTYLASPGKHHETEAIRQHTRTGMPLGNPDFIHQLETITGTALAPNKPGRKPSSKK